MNMYSKFPYVKYTKNFASMIVFLLANSAYSEVPVKDERLVNYLLTEGSILDTLKNNSSDTPKETEGTSEKATESDQKDTSVKEVNSTETNVTAEVQVNSSTSNKADSSVSENIVEGKELEKLHPASPLINPFYPEQKIHEVLVTEKAQKSSNPEQKIHDVIVTEKAQDSSNEEKVSIKQEDQDTKTSSETNQSDQKKGVSTESDSLESSEDKTNTDQNKATSEKDKESVDVLSNISNNVSEIFGNIRNNMTQKPFKDFPGYLQKVPDFDIKIKSIAANDIFPEEFSIKSLKGDVVIVFPILIWSENWDATGKVVFNSLDEVSKELKNKGLSNVKIISVVLSDNEGEYVTDDAVKSYYEENNIKHLYRFKSVKSKDFTPPQDIPEVPTCIVFNKKSVPVWGFTGITNYKDQEFLNFIESLAKED